MNLPTKLSLFVNRIASIRNLVILLVVTLLFSMVVFPWLDAITLGDNGEMLDMRFSYTPEAAYAEIEGYGTAGRSGIMWVSLIADSLFPFAYAFALAILITLTFRRAFPLDSLMQRLHLFPFGALVFDFLENITVSALILLYPRQYYGLARLAAAFTSTKWVLVYLSALLALVGLVGLLFSHRKAAPQP
ncbi:MAG: hypothetical protein JXB38_11255 [Anaerolineales bacterium]|nr:hypothetical protein [Anaerolineales bacterium]